MKRTASCFLFILLTTAISFADTMINDIEYFSKLFPRTEGSSSEKASIEYIKTRLNELEMEFVNVDFSESKGFHSFSSNIEVDIPGKADDTLITLVPMDTHPQFDNRYAGSFAPAAALDLIEYYSTAAPPVNLKFLFLGAEYEPVDGALGTRNFLETFYPESPSAFIYLNISSLPSSLKIVSGADGATTPFWLFDLVKGALETTEIPYIHSNMESILFRLSAAGTESMLAPYLIEGYPAIEIQTGSPLEFSAAAGIKPESKLLKTGMRDLYDNIISGLQSGIPDRWDIHYIFGISEQQYLIIYISLITLLMIYPIFKRRHFRWYMKTLIRNIWSLPVLFLFILGLFALSSLLISGLLNIMGFSELWKYSPIILFSLKISMTLLFYSLTFRFIVKLPFSKRGSFYSISAIFFLVIGLFALSWIDLSISFAPLWTLFFIFLFTIARKPIVKLILLIASATWLVYSLIQIFMLPSFTVIKLISLSALAGNLLLTLIILPFILCAIRLDMLAPPSKKITRFAPVFLIVLSAGLFMMLIFFPPFDESTPQPVMVTETIYANDGRREIEISSPASVKGAEYDDLISAKDISSDQEEKISINTDYRSFLNRKIVDAIIDFKEIPDKISISMLSPQEQLTLYENNYPATWFPSKNTLEIFVGRNPPVPLELSLTINRNAEVNFIISADYPIVTEKKQVGNNFYEVSYKKRIIKHSSDEQ